MIRRVLAVVFAAVSGILFGLLVVTVRIGLRRGDAEVGALVVTPIACAVSAIAAAIDGDLSRVRLADLWPFLVIGLFVPGSSQLLFIQSVRLAGPSRAAILVGVFPLCSAVLAIVFLGEPLRAGLAAGTLVVVLGGAALVGERVRPAGFRALGAAAAVTCAVMFGIRDVLVRAAANDVHPPPLLASAASLLGAALLALVYLAALRREALRTRYRTTLPAFAPAGLTLGLAYSCFVEALARGRVTVAAPLSGTQSLWGVLFAAAVVGRTEMIGRRTVLAGLLVVAGGALISATR